MRKSIEKKIWKRNLNFLCLMAVLAGCQKYAEEEAEAAKQDISTQAGENIQVKTGKGNAAKKAEILTFRDAFGEEYRTEINENISKCPYDKSLFHHDGEKLSYKGKGYDALLGVDVSHHQGDIDWTQVKEQGFDFAFLRIGYRGYGKEGSINADTEFDRNLQNAHKAGLAVGVYFFSQAINEAEAQEEAEFVIQKLNNESLELPVVYDPESILDAEARTDDVSGEQFTENTVAFCETIRKAGYQPMIYSNMLWEAFEFDLERLSDYPIWYADYEPKPQTPYDFEFWQYTNEGSVNGISGNVDLDVWMRK